jgi:16S rRNA C967 or C1407 C5-methylase (RsmB/RsmF family)/NOL1/NOP2/fmu family ribosome biogenesis protein
MELPQAFKQQMQEILGTEYDDFLKSINDETPVSIRINPAKPIELSWNTEKVPWSKLGFYLDQRPTFTLDPLLHAGAYYVQEASSMVLEKVWDLIPRTDKPRAVLDLCAAPGGKSTHLLSMMNKSDHLVANEIHPTRYQKLKENIIRFGYANVTLTNTSPFDLSRHWPERFDVILVDAPCSGEGLFRKDPDSIKEWSEEAIEKCVKRQREILSYAMQMLTPGGFLVYSTCTYNRKENEEQMQWLTQEYPSDSIQFKQDDFPDFTLSDPGLHSFPHRVKGEGFYIALIKKMATKSHIDAQNSIRHPSTKPVFRTIDNEIVSSYLSRDLDGQVYEEATKPLLYLEKETVHWHLDLISLRLCKKIGIETGTLIGKDIMQPAHELALSHILSANIISKDLNLADALTYLRKETLPGNVKLKGYVLMTYKGIGLGWSKYIPNRVNNLLPVGYRIRM